MKLNIALTSTGRKYGYITWPKALDREMRDFLREGPTVCLLLPGGSSKQRNIDWKHRRISVGPSVTRAIPSEITTVVLEVDGAGRVVVTFR